MRSEFSSPVEGMDLQGGPGPGDRNIVTPERQGKRVCYRMADERIAAIVKNALEIMSSESGQ